MATNITVTLETNQVQQALVYARQLFPEATNAELIAALEDAAYWGPGIRDKIASWEAEYTRDQENENRKVSRDDFLEDFPEKVEDPDAEGPFRGQGRGNR